MAVQQNKPTRSKRGMRRSHDALRLFDISISKDAYSGEIHRRHYITRDGFYCGRKIFMNKMPILKKDL